MGGYRPGCTCGGHYRRIGRGLFLRPALGEYVHAKDCPTQRPNYHPAPPPGGGGIRKRENNAATDR